MGLAEYIIFFALVVSTGAGVPGPGDAAMIAAGTLAGEGRLNIGVVLGLSIAGWMLGSLIGYGIGLRGGCRLLERPGRVEKRRRVASICVGFGDTERLFRSTLGGHAIGRDERA